MLAPAGKLCRMISGMDERTFQHNAEQAMERLIKSLYAVEEAAGFDVEERGGAVHLTFEEPPGTFVISPNSAVRQIWISALSTSFKLDWSEAYSDFVLTQTGEPLLPLMARLLTQQTGNAAELL